MSKSDDTNVRFPTGAIATPRTLETHAYRIGTHLDVTDAQTVATADIISGRNDTAVAEDGSISVIDRKRDDIHLGNPIYNFFHCVGSTSTEISSDIRNEISSEIEWKAKNHNQQYATMGNDNEKNETRTSVAVLSNVYEEIRAIKEPYDNLYKYDIQDCHEEKYSSNTTKALIDIQFLPRHEICKECARMKYSPVYTDRLIYTKESLFAIEVVLCQRDDVSCFAYRDSQKDLPDNIFHLQYDRNLQDCMLIYNYAKTNAAGIFYSHWWPRDVFDLRSLLKSNIYVLNYSCRDVIVNTQLYHRYVNNHYVRISKAGCASMTFYCDNSTMISRMRCINYNNDDLQDSSICLMHESRDNEYRRNRSSLLLLEPLLLTSELASSGHKKNTKTRALQSERLKIIRMLIAYALSFFILASITFYIVYFT